MRMGSLWMRFNEARVEVTRLAQARELELALAIKRETPGTSSAPHLRIIKRPDNTDLMELDAVLVAPGIMYIASLKTFVGDDRCVAAVGDTLGTTCMASAACCCPGQIARVTGGPRYGCRLCKWERSACVACSTSNRQPPATDQPGGSEPADLPWPRRDTPLTQSHARYPPSASALQTP